ncbi:hypothetical protein B0H66DRAFT_308132 [Apodospora peruviana]|uniref:Uncharacterized protein n=1 Tax=Apodospora peruviana TaxID=516989 RepID=A0AAE0I3J4_9PEZI|nr:hypothetical protein B0H66DRAFT_308132 [Apodospora peruviana]
MPPAVLTQDPPDLIYGWVSTPNVRGTRDIIISSFATIWLCTWTCLCLNIPPKDRRGHLHVILYKLRWQIFTILFPEVLVATAAEQWLSARQSVAAFHRLGYSKWTIRHGFFADMGGIMVEPVDTLPFAVDSQQLAYLVENKYLRMPDIPLEELKSLNKADGLSRIVTLAQMAWFCMSCAARGAQGLGFCTLEATTLAFILCTLHTFFFWYYKPLDPGVQHTYAMDFAIADICRSKADLLGKPYLRSYTTSTPLDFVKPIPSSRSLVIPFWFGLAAMFPQSNWRLTSPSPDDPKSELASVRLAQTLANSRVLPQDGISLGIMIYTLVFQVAYFGLQIAFAWIAAFPSPVEWYMWILANSAAFGLISVYVVAIPIGARLSPWLGRWLFGIKATSIIEVASALPTWARIAVHAPFIMGYLAARGVVIVESLISLRAMPQVVFDEVSWSGFVPHL